MTSTALAQHKNFIEVTDFPVVWIRIPIWPVVEDVDHAYEELTDLALGAKIVTVFDMTRMNPAASTPTLRAHLFRKIRQLNAESGEHIAAEAIVIPNNAFRVIYQTYAWFVPDPGRPRRTFSNALEARQWAAGQIRPSFTVEWR